MNESSWRRLIDKIRENNVVPIIGSRLLVDARGHSIQQPIAERLTEALGATIDEPLPRFRELGEAVSRLKRSVPLQELYDCVHDAIRTVTSAPGFVVPEALRKLSQISDFRLVVTLTPDDLLARALRQRCAVNEIVHSPNLPTSEGKDLPRDWQDRPGEVQLLYLLGKSRSAPMFAIHEEDMLEYAHNMMAHGSQVPTAFLGELQQRNLLLLGCNFPDWLSRFFLRATNRKRLSENSKRSWLIEPLAAEESLTYFLTSYSKDTEILSETPPTEFVAELHRRWSERHGADSRRAEGGSDEAVPQRAMFFISYSRSTDLPRAEAMFQALLRQGVSRSEVWFDRQAIEPGQRFEQKILDGIRHCRYFLPLLSRAANDREEAFVFREWNEANHRNGGVNRDFILPVVVDAEYRPESYTAMPVRAWTGIDFGHAPEGVPDGRLKTKLDLLVRDARREV